MAKITETELKKQIKTKNFFPAYAICGSEQMYVGSYTDKLIEAVAGKNANEFNLHIFSGEIDLDELAAALQMVSFMSEYNCVVITDIFVDMMNSEDIDKLKAIISKPYEGTVFILSMPSYVPKKNSRALEAIIKKIEKFGSVCRFDKLDRNTLERHIAKWANENGKTISHICASRLIDCCGDDLNLLKNEVNKICAHSAGEEVTLEDIDALATINLEARIFDLSESVLNGNSQKAFQTLDRLFYQKEEPVGMLTIMSMAYVDAYRARVAGECGVDNETVAADFDYGKRTFALNKAFRATSRVSTEALRKSLDLLVKTDMEFKSVSVNYRLAMEKLIAQLAITAKEGRI